MIGALLLLAMASPAAALSPAELARAVARPPADVRLPARLAFRDAATGRAVTLGGAAGGRPAVLLFADYTCRHVCAPGMALTAAALERSGAADYRLLVVGLDPKDGVAEARAFAARLRPMPAAARAATVLLGDPVVTPAATRALGYGYAYDRAADQFAHDASVYVFARDGRFVTLLPELGVAPAAMKAALSGNAPPEGLFARVAHLCYGLAAAHGRYGRPAVLALQALSAALLVTGGVLLLRRRRAA